MRLYSIEFFSGERAYKRHEGWWSVYAPNMKKAKELAVCYLYLLGLDYWWPSVIKKENVE